MPMECAAVQAELYAKSPEETLIAEERGLFVAE
jgi:hypothetical protein